MAKNERLEELRQLARQRQRAANQKVSRLKNNRGVNIAGTQFDPRKDIKRIDRMNTPQLNNYLYQLNHFTSRKNDFVPDASGRPIPGNEWREYKRVERKAKQQARRKFSKVQDLRLPKPDADRPESPKNRGMTLKEREATMKPDHPRAHRPVNSIFQTPDRQSFNIADRKSLRKLQKNLENQFKPQWETKKRNAAKKETRAMLKGLDPALLKKVNSLTADQFNVLWNATSFAANTSFAYHSGQAMLTDKQDSWYSEELSKQLEHAGRLVDWAKTINPNG